MKSEDIENSQSCFPLEKSAERYDVFLQSLRAADILDREMLLPTIEVDIPNKPRELMLKREVMDGDYRKTLQQKIEALSPWDYSIYLGSGLYTGKKERLERFIFRASLVSEAVKSLLATGFNDLTVLDMACNHGYFSLEAAQLGAKHAYGVDLREINIEKAELLKTHFQVPNATFQVGDIYDISDCYDIVYNLGLLYHVTDPYKLMQLTYDKCRTLAVVDTLTHLAPVSAFIQRTNKNPELHAEGAFNVEYHPTYRALIDLMHAVGFKNVVEVVARDNADDAKHPRYEKLNRRCLVGFK